MAKKAKAQSLLVTQEVKIGSQVWSSMNLNCINFRNGDLINCAKNEKEWHEFCDKNIPAFAHVNYNNKNKEIDNGLMYNGYAIVDPRGLAPEGWRLPTKKNWELLIKELKDNVGTKIKSIKGWAEGGNGDGTTNFNALPDFSMNPDGEYREEEDQGMYSEFYTTNESKNILGGLCLDHVILEIGKQTLDLKQSLLPMVLLFDS
jgi:uncharacterized protein (TIGR02145 family)